MITKSALGLSEVGAGEKWNSIGTVVGRKPAHPLKAIAKATDAQDRNARTIVHFVRIIKIIMPFLFAGTRMAI